jgi:hypothetical protein
MKKTNKLNTNTKDNDQNSLENKIMTKKKKEKIKTTLFLLVDNSSCFYVVVNGCLD